MAALGELPHRLATRLTHAKVAPSGPSYGMGATFSSFSSICLTNSACTRRATRFVCRQRLSSCGPDGPRARTAQPIPLPRPATQRPVRSRRRACRNRSPGYTARGHEFRHDGRRWLGAVSGRPRDCPIPAGNGRSPPTLLRGRELGAPLLDLVAVHGDGRGRDDPDSDTVSLDGHHRKVDIAVDHDRLADTPGEN